MLKFEDYAQRMDEIAGPHAPKRSNTAYELGVMRSTGTMAGSEIQGKADIIQRLRPIVMKAFRELGKKDLHPQDIEELLLDSLRLAILYTDPEGGLAGGRKTRMSVTELMGRTKRKRGKYKRGQEEEAADEPEGEESDIGHDDIGLR